MSQIYCKSCEAPLEFGATSTGMCDRCDEKMIVFLNAEIVKKQMEINSLKFQVRDLLQELTDIRKTHIYGV